jgi:dTDP-4-amino-4,6-dideoxygalactose transaminase
MKEIVMLDLKTEYEYMKQDIDSAMRRCLEHQKWIFGPEIEEFEETIRSYIGVKHCIGVSSGTDALVLSLRALAIQRKGQEYFDRHDGIITTPFTFTATGDAILRAGATPVFVDIDPVTCNIDANKIKEYLTSSRDLHPFRVIGILPVHLYGQAGDMDEIMTIADEHNVFVLEDVAQAFGATWRGSKLGSLGHCGAFSFFPSKNLGGFGDAGMVATNDEEVATLVRMLIRHGGKDKYNVDHIGYNSRLDTLHAAVLLAKFKYLDEFNERRKQIARLYSGELSGIKKITLPGPFTDLTARSLSTVSEHVFHQYTVRTPMRDELRKYLRENGISTMVYYPVPLHRMKVFEGRMKTFGHLVNAEHAVGEVLSLPIEPLHSPDDTRFVAHSIKNFFRR